MDESDGSVASMNESDESDDLEPLQWNADEPTAQWCQLRHPEELRQGLTELPFSRQRQECVSLTHPSTGRSLLHELASRPETPESLAMVQLVLGLHGSEGRRRAVSQLDDRRCTPMMVAAAAGNTQALKIMLQCFSSPADDAALVENLRITDGVAGAHRHNAFHRAAEGGMATVRCLWALLAACPRAHWREFLTTLSWSGGNGRSPLTLAIQADCAAAVSLLLDAAAACGPQDLEDLLISAPYNGESSSFRAFKCMAVAAGRCNVTVLRVLVRAFRRLAASAESERTAGAVDSSRLGDGGGITNSGRSTGGGSGATATGSGSIGSSSSVGASASAKSDGGGGSSGAAERACRWYRQGVSEARVTRNRPALLALLDSGSTDAPEALRLLLDLAPSAEEARYALAVQGPGRCTALCKAVQLVQRLKPDQPPDGDGVPVHTAAAAAAATAAASQEVLEELLYRGAQLPGSCMCEASQGTRALVDVLRRNVQLARLPGACNDAIVRLFAYGTAPSRKRLRG